MQHDGFREVNEALESSNSDSSEERRNRKLKMEKNVVEDLDPVRNNLKYKTMAKYRAI